MSASLKLLYLESKMPCCCFAALKRSGVDITFTMCSYMQSLLLSCFHRCKHYSRGLPSPWVPHALTNSLNCADPLTDKTISRFCFTTTVNNLINMFFTQTLLSSHQLGLWWQWQTHSGLPRHRWPGRHHYVHGWWRCSACGPSARSPPPWWSSETSVRD